MNTGYLLIIILMVILSAFFSATEISFNAANKTRLKKTAEEGDRIADLAFRISEDFNTALSAILIGNNLANIAASTTATVLTMELLLGLKSESDSLASVIATAIMTVIILIFGEIVPKIIAKKNADLFVRIFAYPTRILTFILYPLVWVVMRLINLLSGFWGSDTDDLPTVTEDELSSIIETVEEEGIIDEEKSELLQSAIDFSDTTVEEIMTPRIDVVAFDIEDDVTEIRDVIENARYSRLPVYEGTTDDIIGILPINHYYRESVRSGLPDKSGIREMLLEPIFVHKTMKLQPALTTMRENKNHIAIVTDEFGGTMGVVTMEDILEELVGDIWDENDEVVPDIIRLSDSTLTVSGDMNIEDFFDEIEFEPKDFECEYSTVGGWAIQMLDADPHTGDTFTFTDLSPDTDEDDIDSTPHTELFVAVTTMDDMRITKLTVLIKHVEPEEEK